MVAAQSAGKELKECANALRGYRELAKFTKTSYDFLKLNWKYMRADRFTTDVNGMLPPRRFWR